MTKQRGFTLIEIMVGLGIFSFLMMAITFAFNFFWLKTAMLEAKTSSHLDLSVMEKFLFQDLTDSTPSFGNIVKMATKHNNVNFFEIYSSTPLATIPVGQREREFVLD